MDEKFRNFKEKMEIMFNGCCLSCLNESYMGEKFEKFKMFLRQCFEEIEFYPEVFNLVSEKIFPGKEKKIIFTKGGARTSWCHGSHHEFLIEFEKVYKEMKKNPPVISKKEKENYSMFSVLTPDEVINEINRLKIKEGQTITVEREKDGHIIYIDWMIFSSISSSGIIKGYPIEKEEENMKYEDIMRIGRMMVFIDSYDNNIINIYNFFRPFAGPAY